MHLALIDTRYQREKEYDDKKVAHKKDIYIPV